MLGAKNTVNTDEFGAWEAENHGIYSVVLPLVAKITVFTVFFASYRAKTLVFTQFSTCCKRSLRVGGNAKTLYSTMFLLLWHRKKFNLPIRLHAAKSVDLGGIEWEGGGAPPL